MKNKKLTIWLSLVIFISMFFFTQSAFAGLSAKIYFNDGTVQGWENITLPGYSISSGEGTLLTYKTTSGSEAKIFLPEVEKVIVVKVESNRTLVKFIKDMDNGKILKNPLNISGYLDGTEIKASVLAEGRLQEKNISLKKVKFIRLLFVSTD